MMPKPRRTAGATAKRPAKVPPTFNAAVPTETVIATRAYELFLRRGAVHGYDREDWLTAERELRPDVTAEG
jgi:hypothetical protein